MNETQNISQESLEYDLFRGGLWIFLFYACLIYLFGLRNWLYIFLTALLLKALSAHLCRNNINRAMGSLFSFLSLFFIFPFSGNLETRLAALPDFSKAVTALKLNSATLGDGQCTVIQGILILVLTIVSCSFWSSISKIIPEIKFSEKTQKQILLFHRLAVCLFLGTLAGFLLKTVCFYLKFSTTAGWFLQCAGIFMPFLFIGRIRREITEELKKVSGKSEEGLQAMTIPDTKLADVAGMEDVKHQLYLTMINPLKEQKQAERYGIKAGGGILLYGPPGNGKTFLARAVAGELKLPFYTINSADIFSKYVGESELNVQKIFETIRKNKAAVLFIDELESIFRKRSDDIHETTRKIISLLLQELDGIQSHKNTLLLMGATNTPWLIDEAFLRSGRFDSLIYVGLPDEKARLQILQQSFRNMSCPIQRDLLEQTAAATDGFSGADLKGISNQIKQLAFERKVSCCGSDIFKEVLSQASPSVNREIMQQTEQWKYSNSLR